VGSIPAEGTVISMKDLNNHLVIEINKIIQSWSKENPKLVVALDGYSGVGKTTIANEIEKMNSNVLIIHQDDFLISKEGLEDKLKLSHDKSMVFETQNVDYKKLENVLTRYRAGESVCNIKAFNPNTGIVDIDKTYDFSKDIVVVEGVFMFHPEGINSIWDKRIYLDGDIKEINKRRVEREKVRWDKDYFPEDHPDSYFGQVIVALNRYKEKYRPEKLADIVFNIDMF